TLKNAWTTSRQVNFFWVANFNLKFGKWLPKAIEEKLSSFSLQIFKKGGDLAWTLNIFITEKRKDLTS
ncbi:hypothetical protein RLE47_00420, partial [Streptococcus pneumoniae]|nr:hypothetical protein [Streptococcus pneumoniae]